MKSEGLTYRLLGWLLMGSACSGAVSIEISEDTKALGLTGERLQKAYDRLGSGPLNDLGFVLADVALDRDRRFTEYSGDISGRMLGALHSASPVLGEESDLLKELIARIPGYQREDGHFGCEQDLSRLLEKRDMPILWGNGRLLLALAQRARDAHDESLLRCAIRLGDYVVGNRDVYGKKENFQAVGGVKASGFTTCYPSLIQGLVLLGRVTGEEKYLDEAAYIGRLSLMDEALEGRHSHGRLVAYCGLLDLDAHRGTQEFLQSVREGCERIAKDYLLPTGGIPEYFDREYNRDEGCSEADWVRVHFLLWRATGETRYLDTAEHAIRNHMLPLQYPNGGFGHGLFSNLRDGDQTYRWAKIASVGSDSYWCCSMHCTELLADAARWALLKDPSGIRVTWLAEARSRFAVDGASVQVTVEERLPRRWTLTVAVKPKAVRFPLYLRAPGWMDRLLVDGQEARAENGWVKLDREWKGRSRFEAVLEGSLRVRAPYAPGQQEASPGSPARLFVGPDLYGLPEAFVPEGALDPASIPRLLLNGKSEGSKEKGIPALLEDEEGSARRCRLTRLLDRPRGGIYLLGKIEEVQPSVFQERAAAAEPMPAMGSYVELEFGCQGACDLYLNGSKVRRQAGHHEAAQVELYSPPGRQRLDIVLCPDGSHGSGLIGTVRSAEGLIAATGRDNMRLVSVREEDLSLYLRDSDRVETKPGTLSVLGKLGSDPWGWHPGELMGTGAMWVWPEREPGKGRLWVIRSEVTIQ